MYVLAPCFGALNFKSSNDDLTVNVVLVLITLILFLLLRESFHLSTQFVVRGSENQNCAGQGLAFRWKVAEVFLEHNVGSDIGQILVQSTT